MSKTCCFRSIADEQRWFYSRFKMFASHTCGLKILDNSELQCVRTLSVRLHEVPAS